MKTKTVPMTFNYNLYRIIWLVIIMLLFAFGCSSRSPRYYEPASAMVSEEKAVGAGLSESSPAAALAPGEGSTEDRLADRMVHYHGFIRMRATNPDEIIKAAVDKVLSSGGYVERRDHMTVTLRVPVASFQAIFDDILKLGDVLAKSITAEDITDAYHDSELRLRIAQATRDRLMELLKKAKTEKEKLRLLREIQRVNQEIETLNNKKNLLSALARFSRLTLQVQPREAFSQKRDNPIKGFGWIYTLSPFRRDVAFSGRPLEFEVPKGMVGLDVKHAFVVEGADGAVFWASHRTNDPKGDKNFWFAAIKDRLEKDYAGSREFTIGEFKMLELKSFSEKPFFYLIGVNVKDDRLELVEIYFPSAVQQKRYMQVISGSLEKGAK